MDNKIQEFHTGLFIDLNKRHVLLDIVQDLLRKQYDLVAVPGPSLSNCTCEVLLQPLKLHTPHVSITNAKVLLEKYLNMINESKPEKFVRKEPELIVLEASDEEEPIDDVSVVIVDLDESDIPGKEQNSERKSPPNVTSADSDVIVVDSLRKQNSSSNLQFSTTDASDSSKNLSDSQERPDSIVNLDDSDVVVVNSVKSSSPSKLPSSSVSTNGVLSGSQNNKGRSTGSVQNLVNSEIVVIDSIKGKNLLLKSPSSSGDVKSILKESNKQGKKRKKKEKKCDKIIEVVEILDEDVIVLEDSFKTSTLGRVCSIESEPDHSVVESNISLNIPHKESQSKPVCTTTKCDEVESGSSHISSDYPDPPHADPSELTNANPNLIHISIGENSYVNKSLSSGPPKKKSKLAYHRPAHLVTPLTLPTPGVSSSRIDSTSNIYNPNADSSEKRSGLRPIVIDGNNVAIGHGKGSFSLKGLQICINYFEKRGHRQIKVFIPHYRKNRDNHDELHNMERKGLLVVTPSRKVNGKIVASYDDRYIVQYAAEFGGVIVSTDNFRDLLNENPNWKETIENRLLMFTWVDDLLMFPQDPLGRRGPSLDDFLKFPDT